MFNIAGELERRGNEVIPFAVNYAQNESTPWVRYFPDPPTRDRSAVFYRQLHLSLTEKARLAARSIYSVKARRCFTRLLRETRPDFVYFLAIANMLSPSLIDAAARFHVPSAMIVLDYNMACASYHYLRDGHVCVACKRGKYNAIRYRCVQGSVSLSAVRVIGMKVHEWFGSYERIEAFVAPSLTMARELRDMGVPEIRIHHIPFPVDLAAFQPAPTLEGPITYVGRLSVEKGVDCLLRAYAKLPVGSRPNLWVIGDTNSPYGQSLIALSRALGLAGVEFLGSLPTDEVARRLRMSFIVVVPSRWIENSPNTIYEAMASGKPVIAARLGSMVEQVTDGVSGLAFTVDDVDDLAQALSRLLGEPARAKRMGELARARVERENSIAIHVDRLLDLIETVRRDASGKQ